MRSLVAALAIAASLVAAPVHANPTLKFRIVRNIGAGPPDLEVRRAIGIALDRFMVDVRRRMANPDSAPLIIFEFPQPDGTLNEDALPASLPPDVIAVVVGQIRDGGPGWYSPESAVYIGPSPARAQIRHPNLFRSVRGNVSPRFASRNEVQLYELLIGYALLRRAWLENPQLVTPVARALSDRAKSTAGAGLMVSSSTCLSFLSGAAESIIRASSRPDPHGRDPGLGIVNC
jgi:hypothetical protein